MMQNRTKLVVGLSLGCLIALMMAVGGLGIKAQGENGKESKAALSADQVIVCIKTAVAAKPGNVRAMEAESEDGKIICEVEVLAQDGKTYEVEVDVASNTVIEVEEDND